MTSTTASSSHQPDIDIASPQFRRSVAPDDPFLGRLSPGPFSADMSPAYIEQPHIVSSTSGSSIPSITIPQHPPPVLQGTPLLDDRESLAYSDFLDKLALDSDFIFDPVLPDNLPSWPFSSSAGSPPALAGPGFPPLPHSPTSPQADIHLVASPSFVNGKVKSKSLPQSIPWSSGHHPNASSPIQLPLLPTAEIVGPPLTLDAIRSGHINAEERALLLRTVHRQQGLAWGSDPRFSKSGFKLNPDQTEAQSNAGQNHRRGHSASESDHVAASEILRQMSQDGAIWHSDRTDDKAQGPQHGIPPSVLHAQPGTLPGQSSSSSVSSSVSPSAVSPDAVNSQRKRSLVSVSPALTAASIKSDQTPVPAQQKRPRKASPQYVDMPSSNPNRELLTEEQRRKNHISSEKKRRDIIKQGFDELSHLVPVLRAGGFSKSTVLGHVVEFLSDLERKNQQLKAIVEKLEKDRVS
ncbi:hypothetical protein V1525DRAFT_393170 [Lipomyces kononenkoae]|uniref:Uncharacterized protein n=1 Tax=Lipomyces kononenkoae TaxID=34357 RepID=A0ACC3TD28_LIPKO